MAASWGVQSCCFFLAPHSLWSFFFGFLEENKNKTIGESCELQKTKLLMFAQCLQQYFQSGGNSTESGSSGRRFIKTFFSLKNGLLRKEQLICIYIYTFKS